MSSIAEALVGRIAEHDPGFAKEVLIDEFGMDDKELDYFGISKADLEIEDNDEE